MYATDHRDKDSSKAADGNPHKVFVYGLQNGGSAGLIDGYLFC